MSWSTHLRSAGDFVKIGDEVEAEVLTLDREERKISLGIKQFPQIHGLIFKLNIQLVLNTLVL
jgi:ribosomal protein S1